MQWARDKALCPMCSRSSVPRIESIRRWRNLLRQLTWSLPSGQNVPKAMGVKKLTPGELRDLKPYSFEKSTPPWCYALREAELQSDGLTLGRVGGRIVA
jgi:hypothetical protein